jgi:4-amino-4-deoxy-L-arabinose transferase-like glycosyltransferase
MQPTRALSNAYVFVGVLVALACLRLCFAGVLWSDEDYHMAAAIQILHGKLPYRDFWYDKPPLAALYYLLMGALPGLILRLWDAAYILLCCFLAYKLAKAWWGEAEGRLAALFVAFFTTFYLPAAVIPFAPDALLIAPHLAAIYFARQGRAWAAGLVCGLGFWINVKAVFVVAACAIWVLVRRCRILSPWQRNESGTGWVSMRHLR